MSSQIVVKRVTVVADTTLEKALLAEFLKLGAKGYTCVYVFGKGQHQPLEDPFTGHSRIRIECVVTPDAAEAILDYIHEPQFQNYAIIGYVEDVQARSDDRWF